MTKVSRELKAITFDPNSFPSVLCTDGGVAVIPDEADPFSSRTLFNFQKWGKKNALIYKPNFSGAWFFHHSRCFYWSTGQRQNRCGEGYDRTISIRCFGRSTQPVKDLLSDIKGFTLTQEFRTTEVHRSALKSNEQGCQWLRQLVRPARPMCTISLGDDQKANIIQDMNNYLHPATARWYATRGIPYRRGYLLHGPPGTGKTSLSFALAGVFGLSIYCIALGETGLTESDLATLFSGLPERCIVLLEDVDSAGLRGGSQDVPSNRRSDSDSENVPVPKHVKRAKSMGRTLDKGVVVGMGDNKARSLITLAGLLNIVDGAASQEVSSVL
jgi:chaperone BCS1